MQARQLLALWLAVLGEKVPASQAVGAGEAAGQ